MITLCKNLPNVTLSNMSHLVYVTPNLDNVTPSVSPKSVIQTRCDIFDNVTFGRFMHNVIILS